MLLHYHEPLLFKVDAWEGNDEVLYLYLSFSLPLSLSLSLSLSLPFSPTTVES